MATRTVLHSALAGRIARRFLSSSSASLLGHFYHPISLQDPSAHQMAPRHDPAFQPLTAKSPELSLDFVPDLSSFEIYDSHLGILLLRRKPTAVGDGFLVCDPVSRRHALFPPPPINRFSGGEIIRAALLSRAARPAGGGLSFEAVCVAVDVDRPRCWVATFGDGGCRWSGLPRSREVTVEFDPVWFERICVHAAGSLYWHICNNGNVLALDAATKELSFLRAPSMMWDWANSHTHKYRVGEMPDGRLCVASLERLFVRGKGKFSDNGWVPERMTRMKEVLDTVPGLPKDPLERHFKLWLSDIDAGRTGRVFIQTEGYGSFSFDIFTRKLERLVAEGGMAFGHPIFAYFSAPDGRSA